MRSIILIMVLITATLTGCGVVKDTEVPSGAFPGEYYQVTDDKGNVLEFNKKPTRIYATTLSIEEILVDLVPLNRIVAISEPAADTKISLIADKAAHISVKLPQKASTEKILSLKPDLVIVQENSNAAFIQSLKDVGLKVYITKVPTTVKMVRSRIINLAAAVGEKQQGGKIINELDNKTETVKKVIGQIPKSEKKNLMAYSLLGVFGSAEGLFHDICISAGVTNGAALAGGEHLSKEKIVEVDPDILMFSDYSSTQEGDSELFRKEVLDDPALQSIKAIKNKNIIIIRRNFLLKSQWVQIKEMQNSQNTYNQTCS